MGILFFLCRPQIRWEPGQPSLLVLRIGPICNEPFALPPLKSGNINQDRGPETVAMQASDRTKLLNALESLPVRAREVIVLRELEGCSYKEISEVTGIPLGTVMSSLSRAREKLAQILGASARKEASNEL